MSPPAQAAMNRSVTMRCSLCSTMKRPGPTSVSSRRRARLASCPHAEGERPPSVAILGIGDVPEHAIGEVDGKGALLGPYAVEVGHGTHDTRTGQACRM